jgi:hypothetical protein
MLTVVVITRLTTSQTGPLHPATVTGRKAHNAVTVLTQNRGSVASESIMTMTRISYW